MYVYIPLGVDLREEDFAGGRKCALRLKSLIILDEVTSRLERTLLCASYIVSVVPRL
jgi:hypothetical protein